MSKTFSIRRLTSAPQIRSISVGPDRCAGRPLLDIQPKGRFVMSKAGRKRKSGKREPNGQLSRRKADVAERFVSTLNREERDVIGVGLAARIRVHKVQPELSRDQMAGSYIGRLCLAEKISSVQYDAAMMYAADVAAYRSALSAPRQPGAVDLNATHGASNYDPVEAVRHAIVKMDGELQPDGSRVGGIRRAVQDRQNALRGTVSLFAALSLLVLEDRELPNLLDDLRQALDALVVHYRLSELVKTEAA